MIKRKESGYVTRGQKLLEEGKTKESMVLVTRGLQHYSEKVLSVLTPYAKADAGLVVIALRHIANEIERNNPGTKEFVEEMNKCIVAPEISEIEKVKKVRDKRA